MLKVVDHRAHCKLIMKGVMAIALFIGFSSLSLAKPSEVKESAVRDCNFLGKVEGSSGYGKNMGWQPLAKSAALHRAQELGASHVVWQRMIPVGAFNGIAVARAYGCSH